MISAFGVDHGEISKADDKYGGHGAPTGGRRAAAYLAGPFHSGVAGKPGKKLRATGNAWGGGLAGASVGHMAGRATGAALTRGRGGVEVGGSLGSLAGAITGNTMGVNRNQRQGYYKKQKR